MIQKVRSRLTGKKTVSLSRAGDAAAYLSPIDDETMAASLFIISGVLVNPTKDRGNAFRSSRRVAILDFKKFISTIFSSKINQK